MIQFSANNYTNINNAAVDAIMQLKDNNGKLLASRFTYLAIYVELQKWWNISFANSKYSTILCFTRSAVKLSGELGISNKTITAALQVLESLGLLIRIPKGFNQGHYFVVLGNYETDTTKKTHAPNIRKQAEYILKLKEERANTFAEKTDIVIEEGEDISYVEIEDRSEMNDKKEMNDTIPTVVPTTLDNTNTYDNNYNDTYDNDVKPETSVQAMLREMHEDFCPW